VRRHRALSLVRFLDRFRRSPDGKNNNTYCQCLNYRSPATNLADLVNVRTILQKRLHSAHHSVPLRITFIIRFIPHNPAVRHEDNEVVLVWRGFFHTFDKPAC
jgi:hypothetical protein